MFGNDNNDVKVKSEKKTKIKKNPTIKDILENKPKKN